MFYRIRSATIKIGASILASIAYRIETFLDHYHGIDYALAVWEYDNALRNKIKHSDDEGSYEKARDMLWDEFRDRGLDIRG